MREQLLQRIMPVVEQLAEQLVDMLLQRVEQHVNQLELAFDAATSAFASDLDSSTTAVCAVEDNPRPTKRSKGAATPGQGASSAAGNVAEPQRVPIGHRDSAAVVDPHKRTNSCRKCGAIGFTARTCGKTHNVSTSPAISEVAPSPRARAASSPATSTTSSPPPQSLRSVRCDRSVRTSARRREAIASRPSRLLRSTRTRTDARSCCLCLF